MRDQIPKKLPPSAFEPRVRPWRLRVLFGGPALRHSVRRFASHSCLRERNCK